jgi:hypothetical protein
MRPIAQIEAKTLLQVERGIGRCRYCRVAKTITVLVADFSSNPVRPFCWMAY